jgi:RNA polymerase sigma-70 factor (ECF subfamily)
MADTEEQDLVRRCQGGDERAFAELVTRYQNLVFALVLRTVQDRSRAEDLAQEVFLRVYRGLPYFRGEAKLSTWIFRIVVNLCSQERGRSAPEAPLEPLATQEGGRADARFQNIELRDQLEKAIARLPVRERLLIAGHYLKDLQYDALAAALDIPMGTVKTQIFRAKRRLRELLQEQTGPPGGRSRP